MPLYDCFNPRAHAGRDEMSAATGGAGCGFNPRAHAGRDAATNEATAKMLVSIHAPTRGATIISINRMIRIICFNPRAHAGRDIDRCV